MNKFITLRLASFFMGIYSACSLQAAKLDYELINQKLKEMANEELIVLKKACETTLEKLNSLTGVMEISMDEQPAPSFFPISAKIDRVEINWLNPPEATIKIEALSVMPEIIKNTIIDELKLNVIGDAISVDIIKDMAIAYTRYYALLESQAYQHNIGLTLPESILEFYDIARQVEEGKIQPTAQAIYNASMDQGFVALTDQLKDIFPEHMKLSDVVRKILIDEDDCESQGNKEDTLGNEALTKMREREKLMDIANEIFDNPKEYEIPVNYGEKLQRICEEIMANKDRYKGNLKKNDFSNGFLTRFAQTVVFPTIVE